MLITGEPDRCPSSSLWRAERSRLRQQCSDPQVGLTLRHDNHINRLILSEGLKLAVEDVDGNSEPGFHVGVVEEGRLGLPVVFQGDGGIYPPTS